MLPALSVRRGELRRSLRRVTAGITLCMLFFAFVRGSHLPVFCRMLGFSNLAIGVFSAIPFFATFLQPVGAMLAERTGLRKHQFIFFGTIHRSVWILVPLVLLLPVPSVWAVLALLAISMTSDVIASFSNPAWWSWIGELIPKRIRGRFIASHNRISKCVAIVAALLLGVLFDRVTVDGAPETAAGQPVFLWVAAIALAIGGVFGAIDILLYRKVRDLLPRRPEEPSGHSGATAGEKRGVHASFTAFVHDYLIEPLHDRAFRHYVGFAMASSFAAASSYMFYFLHALESLHFTKLATNGLMLVILPMCWILTAKRWGRLIDRWGHRPVLFLATSLSVLSFVPILLASPGLSTPAGLVDAINSVAGWLGALFGRPDTTWVSADTPIVPYLIMAMGFAILGTCVGAVMMVRSAIRFGFADRPRGSIFVGAESVLAGIGGVAGALIGGAIAESLNFMKDQPLELGPFAWNQFHVVFALSALVRLSSMAWLVGMPDPGSGGTREMMRALGTNVYQSVAMRLLYPLRLIRPNAWRGRNNAEDSDK